METMRTSAPATSMGLRCDELSANNLWIRQMVAAEGLGSAVEAGLGKLPAPLQDVGFELRAGLMGAGSGPARAGLQSRVAALVVAG